jgi:hypothetical protein
MPYDAYTYMMRVDGLRRHPKATGWRKDCGGISICRSDINKGFVPHKEPLSLEQLGVTQITRDIERERLIDSYNRLSEKSYQWVRKQEPKKIQKKLEGD